MKNGRKMKIFINDKELSFTLENEQNAYDVLKGVEEWCNSNNFLINKIIINNNELHPYIDEEYEKILIENIDNIYIEALSNSEYYLSSLNSIMDYIKNISVTDSAILNERDIEDLKDGFAWILDSIPRVIFLCNMSLESHNSMHLLKMLEVKLERLTSLTEKKEDIEKIRDYFNDDIKPFINDKLIPAMELIMEDAKINTIIMFSSNINSDNALYKIGTLPKFYDFIIELLDKIVGKLQTGNDKEAFLYAEKFSRVVSFSFTILSKVADICSIDYNNIKINKISLYDSIEDFNSMMNNVLEAFSNEDYISIADILEYEIKDKLKDIINYIPVVEEYIEKLNV